MALPGITGLWQVSGRADVPFTEWSGWIANTCATSRSGSISGSWPPRYRPSWRAAERSEGSMADQVGVAVVGCGYSGHQLCSRVQRAGRRACRGRVRPENGAVAGGGAPIPGVAVTTQLDAAIGHDGVDAVVVCDERDDALRRDSPRARRGKHVLCEKPLTTRSADAELDRRGRIAAAVSWSDTRSCTTRAYAR